EGQTVGSLMAQTPSLQVIFGTNGQAWVLGKRAPSTRCPNVTSRGNPTAFMNARAVCRADGWYLPDDMERQVGMRRACYAVVYQDRMQMNPFSDPFDLNSVRVDQIEAIEWYSGATQAPPMYSSRRATCGVLVIHSRRP